MTRRALTLWTVAAGIFTLINLAGAPYALLMGETIHGGVHVALTFVGAFVFWRLASRRLAESGWRWRASDSAELFDGSPDRLDNLQQSLDAVAIEVERIGESQRFMTQLVAEQGAAETANSHSADPAASKPPRPAP